MDFSRDKLILTWAAYLMYLSQGIIIVLAGAITPIASQTMNVSPALLGYSFGIFSLFRASVNYSIGPRFERINFSKILIISTSVASICLLLLLQPMNIYLFTVIISIMGAMLGVHYSFANNIILNLYSGNIRASKYAFISFAYSFGAFAAPLFVRELLSRDIYWGWGYVACIPFMLLILLGLTSKLKLQKITPTTAHKTVSGGIVSWNKYIISSAAALVCSGMAESIATIWLALYMHEKFGFSLEKSALSLAILWGGFAIGRFVSGYIAKFIAPATMVFILDTILLVSFSLLLFFDFSEYYVAIIFAIGFGFSGIYGALLAYGLDQTENPSPKLVTILTTCSSAGGIIGFFVSSTLKHFLSTSIALGSSFLFAVTILILTVYSYYAEKKERRIG